MEAIVVLGARVRPAAAGKRASGGNALDRRIDAGARLFAERPRSIVVASGGRLWSTPWGDVLEADAIRDRLVALGVPAEAIVRERCSFSTRENAIYTAALLRRRGIERAWVVTCDWHLPRSLELFRRTRLDVQGVAAAAGPAGPLTRLWRWGRERVALRLDRMA